MTYNFEVMIEDPDCSELPASAVCPHAAASLAELTRLAATAQLCTRLFPEQLVLQTACRTRCAGDTSQDGQACAFAFARASRDIIPQGTEPHPAAWAVVIAAAVLGAACWFAMRTVRRLRR